MHVEIYRVFSGLNAEGNLAAVISTTTDISLREATKICCNLWVSALAIINLDQACPYEAESYQVRCFGQAAEIGFCGHGTLAAAKYLCQRFPQMKSTKFLLKNHKNLQVYQHADPNLFSFTGIPFEFEALEKSSYRWSDLGLPDPNRLFHGNGTLVCLYSDPMTIFKMMPNFDELRTNLLSVAVSSRIDENKIVSRYFSPASGQNEDSATGSAHMLLGSIWHHTTGQGYWHATQASKAGGELQIFVRNREIEVMGSVVHLESKISLS